MRAAGRGMRGARNSTSRPASPVPRPASHQHMSRLSRTLTALGALLLLALYIVPLWSIQLFAPQYPEGLGMSIRLTTVVGDRPNDLQTINQLNHYIGMKH